MFGPVLVNDMQTQNADDMQTPSKLAIYGFLSKKKSNVLKPMKKQFSDVRDIYFLRNLRFRTQNL